MFQGWGDEVGDSKAKGGVKIDIFGKVGKKKSCTGGAKNDDGSKPTKAGDKPCSKCKSS